METQVTTGRKTARERLLDAADELFYAEGIRSVGIDRVIEQAGVAKASLYNTFGSKDELIRAYLHARHVEIRDRVAGAVAQRDSPRDQLLAVFDALADRLADPSYRGCAFINASAEAQPGSVVVEASDEHRAWLRGLFVDLARAAGAADPSALAAQLVLLYDGAVQSARMDRDPAAARTARTLAESLLDSAR